MVTEKVVGKRTMWSFRRNRSLAVCVQYARMVHTGLPRIPPLQAGPTSRVALLGEWGKRFIL